MQWLPWFISVVMIASTATMIYLMRVIHELREDCKLYCADASLARTFMHAVLDRTNGLIACDECGKPITEAEPAAVRITPYGTVFGHVMCLPPMPESR